MSKYIPADKLIAEIERLKSVLTDPLCSQGNILGPDWVAGGNKMLNEISSVITSLQQKQEDMGEVSDGYHTFNELYLYRMLYNAAFFNELAFYDNWADGSWNVDFDVHKSKKHSDGEECFGGGWFIVIAELPTGQISNHYEMKYWDLFKIPEKEFANKWDGHTPQEAADRLYKYLQQEQPEVDFEKEAVKFVQSKEFIESKESPVLLTAHHFYELGLNARKEK